MRRGIAALAASVLVVSVAIHVLGGSVVKGHRLDSSKDIYFNGRIYTMNAEQPVADNTACTKAVSAVATVVAIAFGKTMPPYLEPALLMGKLCGPMIVLQVRK